MNILYPKIRLALLPKMLGYTVLGGLLAGVYGMVHDQITYSISHDYFTQFKFAQFHYADFGWPPRVFVAEIGFLATWWVGFIGAWFIARLTVPSFPPALAFRCTLRGFAVIFAVALTAFVVAYILGMRHGPDYSAWQPLAPRLSNSEMRGFVQVAYIHNAGYLGGLIGLVAAIVYIQKFKKTEHCTEGNAATSLTTRSR